MNHVPRLRTFGFCALLALLSSSATALSAVVINEIHAAPDIDQERVEFVELHNNSPQAVNIGGWQLSGGVEFILPPATSIAPGAYLVIAQDPPALQRKFGFATSLGPWTGRLSGRGERVTLIDATGTEIDSVNFQLGFPWPTVGEAPGNSIELIHPSLDNSLGGHWRSSTAAASQVPDLPLIPAASTWRYRKGTSEPSTPTSAWRSLSFDDATWASGPAPVGYDPDVLGEATTGGTRLSDMRGNYTTFYLRRSFDAPGAEPYRRARIEALFDDGFKVWINGTLILARDMATAEVPFNGVSTAVRESNAYQPIEVSIPTGLLLPTGNVIAVQVANANLSGSSDCFFDCRFTLIGGTTGQGPTPGFVNRVFATNAPPALRQVSHTPEQPRSGQPVVISIRATDPDGIASVQLEYQIVRPGQYIRSDSPAYLTGWTPIVMNDAGLSGDAVANDNNFAAVIPGSIQTHRHLIRYRIRATDSRGASVVVPYADDAGRNFAYFTYDGVPAWTGAVRPGAAGALGQSFTVSSNEMNRLPVYHLLGRRQDIEDATWRDRSRGDEYFWTGTLVYDGEVYDNIRFRPRGGVWRYAMGKNMWKFDFNRGRDFRGRDNWGRRFRADWTKLNLGASIQQGDYLHRGEHGMFESVGFRLFELTGTTGCDTAYVQFRIIDDAAETASTDQYSGDFWGVYLAIEQPDGRYLEAHDLPDGNLYKMEGGFGDANNLGPDGPTDSSDLSAFMSAYNTTQTEAWWRANFNLPAYFRYQAVVQGIHHYDIADGKNYYFYRNPVDNRWQTIAWDLDLTWADNMYRAGQTGGDEPFKSRVLSNFTLTNPRYPNISREFRNYIRHFRDLLWNSDEAFRLLDEHARLLRGTNAMSLIDADRAQWDYNPIMINGSLVNTGKAGHGRYYQSGVGTRDFNGMVTKMRNYILYRATHPTFSFDGISAEPERPSRPLASFTGAPGFPVDRLGFAISPYSGAAAQASVQWRIAEITRTNHPSFDPSRPAPYEITPVVESGPLAPGTTTWTPPAGSLRVGRLYRARAQFTDAVGRNSNWSDPIEFTAAEPVGASSLAADFQFTELMYNPAEDGFEFLEFRNRNAAMPLDLSGARFTAGIDFQFPAGTVLAPGEYGLILRSTNIAAFRQAYGLHSGIRVLGTYGGALANEGETITVRASAGSTNAVSIAYSSAPPWPVSPNGTGFSLVTAPNGNPDPSSPAHWKASNLTGGSPGGPDDLAITSAERSGSTFTLRYAGGDAGIQVWTSPDINTWERVTVTPANGSVVVPDPPDANAGFIRLMRVR
jgi:CotH kinase protein/Lamin Tail Domain